jgi:hypothetical protein
MLGLIFMTWEKYLGDRFGEPLLNNYRSLLGDTSSEILTASRYYDDELLYKGVGVASQLVHQQAETLMREYGRYFIVNALTNKLCSYLLTQVHSGRELLLAMRESHTRIQTAFEGATPPVFEYGTTSDPEEIVLIYRSERGLCPVLLGAIEGAALRYNERVRIIERTCMKHGAPACRFEARFFPNQQQQSLHNPALKQHQEEQNRLSSIILTLLPYEERHPGYTLEDIQKQLAARLGNTFRPRIAVLFEAVQRLQFAGLARCNANDDTGAMLTRRYWRTPPISY